jgi:hypothetical protein
VGRSVAATLLAIASVAVQDAIDVRMALGRDTLVRNRTTFVHVRIDIPPDAFVARRPGRQSH